MARDVAQLERALRAADAAGDVEAATKLAAAIRAERSTIQQPPTERGSLRPGVYADAALLTAKNIGRQALLGGQSVLKGVLGATGISPAADALATGANLGLGATGSSYRFPMVNEAIANTGLPQPETTAEKVSDFGSQMLTGGAMGGAISRGLTNRFGLQTPQVAPISRASTPAARTLETAGVPLSRDQRTGGRFSQMLRSAVTDHPVTATRQAQFTEAQSKAFTRAVLRSIGANADEATQDVMAAAKGRIGSVFDGIGKQGAQFDDALQAELAQIVDDAQRTTTASDLAPFLKNVDDLLNAVDENGVINGDRFNRIRSLLSKLSRSPGVGGSARELEDAMLGALERTHPGQKAVLRDAVDQWRNLRTIETAIGKGTERYISPRILSNAMATQRNRAMSVYGQGGDQGLVQLAQAGRSVLPEVLPNSGTNPRGLMTAPLRAIASAPLYKAAQGSLLSQPSGAIPQSGMLPSLATGAAAGTGALSAEERWRRRMIEAAVSAPPQ